ncbi:hypothetical protein EJ06DRAFT_458055, partial [Trichodelitschia bisporula]
DTQNQCRLVHSARDKCAFVKRHCIDEDAGIFSYLRLYYCTMPKAQPIAFTIIILWLSLLFSTIGIAASDFFCVNLSTIATLLGLSDNLAGVTFLAFGNGSPDVFSTFAAMGSNSGSLAVGELIGAASFITAVVAGSMAFVRPFKVSRRSFVRDVAFFIVAATLSLYFLYDGKLYWWEAAAMVGLYVFYVAFVVVWHWFFTRRRTRRQTLAAARQQFVLPNDADTESVEEYHDEDEPRGQRSFNIDEELALLSSEGGDDDEEDAEDRGRRLVGEISSNMRLSRPRLGERRLTQTPIRPSLVGALEFRSVLMGLNKSQNLQSIPLHLRRYSEELRDQDRMSILSEPHSRAYDVLHQDQPTPSPQSRSRAISASAVDALAQEHNMRDGVPKIDLLAPLPEDNASASPSPPPTTGGLRPVSPSISLSPPASAQGSRAPSPAPDRAPPSPSLLAPPDPFARPPRPRRTSTVGSSGSRDLSPFPAYTDDPSPLTSVANLPERAATPTPSRTPTWHTTLPTPSWLPPKETLLATLFPTLYNWPTMSHWERFLGTIAAPSVFLLTITLPVVETDRPGAHDDDVPPMSLPASYTDTPVRPSTVRKHSHLVVPADAAIAIAHETPTILEPDAQVMCDSPEQMPVRGGGDWARWLVALQAFTAPLFVVLAAWAAMGADDNFTVPVLAAIGLSVLLVFLVFAFSARDRAPKWRVFLSFVGFLVGIAWISSIANEVVGVLKAIGVVLGISDAILGLTIFAVGNSLGDLVADVTVAKLGYPVMALSACFGGPMPFEVEVERSLMVSGATLLVTLVGLLVVVPLRRWKMDRVVAWGLIGLWSVSTLANVAVEI